MAHFAEILSGVVQRVIVVHNNELLVDGVETESKGAQFCANLFGGEWVQTSYNAATNGFRKQYAGIGYSYNTDLNIFIAPQPYPSWVLDENHDWQPPTPMPVVEGKRYAWFEANQEWIELN
jgi:hypothetical protein